MIPYIKLEGTPFDMGFKYGEFFKIKIHELALKRLHRLSQFINIYCGHRVGDEALICFCEKILPCHEKYDADIWLEFCGIAKGAGISYPMLLIAMGYTDIRDYISTQLKTNLMKNIDSGGCTSFAIPASLSAQGVLYGQTWDMSPEVVDYLVLVERRPQNAPVTLYLTTMGCLGLIGLNSAGIVVGNTNLMSKDSGEGVIYLFTISKALKMTSLNSAVNSIHNTERLAGHNFFVSDEKLATNIEATAAKSYQFDINGRAFTHTNHYLFPHFQNMEMEKVPADYASTRYRCNRMNQNISAHGNEPWNADNCWNLLGDSVKNESGSAICNMDFENKASTVATVASCLLIPAEKTMWCCPKGVGHGERQIISI